MRIIDNINGSHTNELLFLVSSADEMVLVSPFLMIDFDEFIFIIAQLGVTMGARKRNSENFASKAASR